MGDFYGGPGNDFIQGGTTGDDYSRAVRETTTWREATLTVPPAPTSSMAAPGRDSLHGYDENDVIYGGDDDDLGTAITVALDVTADPGLFGYAGDDYLDGGRGNDLLDGF